jgi:uncharacterized protein YgiM (DUF1202 family)
MKITREVLEALITRGDEVSMIAIGRALVHLLKRQTSEEAAANTTRNNNQRGFTPNFGLRKILTASRGWPNIGLRLMKKAKKSKRVEQNVTYKLQSIFKSSTQDEWTVVILEYENSWLDLFGLTKFRTPVAGYRLKGKKNRWDYEIYNRKVSPELVKFLNLQLERMDQ